MMNPVLTSAKFIAENSDLVQIDDAAAKRFAQTFSEEHVAHWFNQAPIDISCLSESERLNFLLVCNAVSFSYWGRPKWTIQYQGRPLDGAYGMMAALFRRIEEKEFELTPESLSKLNRTKFSHILRGNVEIPLLDERLKHIRECGAGLLASKSRDLSEIIEQSNYDAMLLLEKIINRFPSFNDTSTFKGKTCFFHKRAQLLVSDIANVFQKKKIGKLKNLHLLTGLADYKVPQILREKGILLYSKPLANQVDNQKLLIRDSQEENEIRGNTVYALEKIADEVRKKYPAITPIHVNDHLWLATQIKHPDWRPYHLVRTTSY
ncbi:MAG: queuosine salvage family protein [Candidatus Diapherotrites archaeon]